MKAIRIFTIFSLFLFVSYNAKGQIPTGYDTTNIQNVCLGDIKDYYDLGINGDTFEWLILGTSAALNDISTNSSPPPSSGNGPISGVNLTHVYIHWNVIGTFTLQITEKTATIPSCSATKILTIIVNPKPSIVITNPPATCSPATVDLTLSSVTSGSTIGLTYTYWSDAGATVPFTTATTATTGTYYIKGTVAASGCYSIQPVTVTVNASPTVIITNPAAVCSPATVNLTATAITTGSTTGLTYTYWTNSNATNTYTTPSTAGSGIYYIKGTITTTGCYSIQPVTVTINPTPTIVITNPSVCSPATADLTTTTVTNGSTTGLTYTYWTNALTTNSYTTPTTAVAGTYYIKGTVSSSGCYSIQPVTVTVNPTPTLVITNPPAVCTPTTVDLTTASITSGSTNGLTYTYWTNSTATNTYSTPTTASAGTYYIKGTVSSTACFSIQSVTVTVNPSPTVVITTPAASCSPSTVDLTLANVTTGSTAGLTYTYWSNAGATASYTTPTTAGTGTYYIKGTNTVTGCYSIQPVTVTINPSPSLVITNPAAVCSPATVDLTAASVTTGSTTGMTYTYWTNAGATVSYTTPTIAGAGMYYIKGTVTTTGCFSIQAVSVTVNPTPTVVITTPAASCSPSTVDLTLATITAGSTTGLTYSYWTNVTATVSYATPTTAGAGTYYIKGIVTATGCYSIQPVTVTINPTPTLVISNPTALCSPSTVNLTTAAITSGSTSGLSYTYWTNAGATVSYSTPSTASAGTYYIKGTVIATGCYSIQPVTVIINPLPTITGTLIICVGNTTQLTGSPTAATINPWISGTPSVATVNNTGLVTGISAGVSIITYTNNNSCSNTAQITVNPLPTPSAIFHTP